MPGLADTIGRLSQLRGKLPQAGFVTGVDRLTDIDDFGSNPGGLRARTYIPQGLKPGSPLVVVLHGCTQTAAGYDHGAGWSTLADQHGFALLFPEQTRANNPNLCFNWFLPPDIQRDQGEALSIYQMVMALQALHQLDTDRAFVTGLSAGGAMTSVMLATYPEVFAGGAIIAGLSYGVASSVPEAFGAMQGSGSADPVMMAAKVRSASGHSGRWPIVSVWHGSGDRTVAASNGRAIVEQWRAVHGLPETPSESTSVGTASRDIWRDAEGRAILEELVIPGMGHGTPVQPSAEGGGVSGAYMLDVGISSSLEICRFWDIETGSVAAAAVKAAAPSKSRVATASAKNSAPRGASRPAARKAPPEAPAETGVTKVINDALRAAGLMR